MVKCDENGTEYIEKHKDELTKNHREFDLQEEGGIILATGKRDWPVNSFKLYISKLNPKLDNLFQRPKVHFAKDGHWYDAQVLGVRSIE